MNVQSILSVLFALLVGLLGGYLLFGGIGNPSAEQAQPTSAHPRPEGTAWTCSMHPHVRRHEPGACPVCGMDLVAVTEAAAADPTILTMSEAAVAMARVRTTTVGGGEREADKATVQLTGRLALNGTTTKVQSVNYGGRLDRLLVTYPGERVREGQRIATIYSPELVVAQQELLEARQLASLSPELLTTARKKLRNFRVTDEQIARLEESGEVVSDFPVFAERSGTVLDIRARVGDYVSGGAALYTLTDLGTLWAIFDAYERDLASVSVGDRISIAVASRPGETFSARVSFIDPLIDPATRTAAIRAEVGNRSGVLKPEMFVRGEIRPAAARRGPQPGLDDEGLIVPKTAVLWTGERSVVYVSVPGTTVPTYRFREVSLGASTGRGYVVTAGLQIGEEVVTNGAFQLDAAAQLRNQSSMMNREVAIRGRVTEGVTGSAPPDSLDTTLRYYLRVVDGARRFRRPGGCGCRTRSRRATPR